MPPETGTGGTARAGTRPGALTRSPASDAAGGAHLSIGALGKRFGQTVAVEEVSLAVEQGEFVSLLGPSGCGKTTTLRMVAGFLEPTSGEILVDGRDVTALPPYRRNMGMVFQNYALFPHMNVAKNVAFGLEMRRLAKAEIDDRARRALSRVHLDGYADRRIRELSGGQQQRVALARALVVEPSVLLLDEPLSNLDKNLRDSLRKEIREIQQEFGITTLFVTHDQGEALTMSDRIVVLNAGRVEQVGTPEDVYERPATPFVAAFIGKANFVGARAVGSGGTVSGGPGGSLARLDHGGEAVALTQELARDARVTIMVRPHKVNLSPAAAGSGEVRGVVRAVTYLGEIVQYEVAVGSLMLSAERHSERRGSGAYRPGVGDEVFLSWDPEDALVFEEPPEKVEDETEPAGGSGLRREEAAT